MKRERERDELTHPRFTSKYVFMRMQQTGKSGTNGQMKPEEKLRIHLINLCGLLCMLDFSFI